MSEGDTDACPRCGFDGDESPTAVSIVDYSGDEETVMARTAFDTPSQCADAVEFLLELWSFDASDEARIEVQRA